ncbi:MAG: hypothetical protein NVSMB21_03000 [Vulcanimicrobiaceae bacterium]
MPVLVRTTRYGMFALAAVFVAVLLLKLVLAIVTIALALAIAAALYRVGRIALRRYGRTRCLKIFRG